MTDQGSEAGLAIGVLLRLRTPTEGGRRQPLALDGYRSFQLRPNWRIPHSSEEEQHGAPLADLGRAPLEPGATSRAVVVPLSVGPWRLVRPGDVLEMFEAMRSSGHATVVWIRPTTLR